MFRNYLAIGGILSLYPGKRKEQVRRIASSFHCNRTCLPEMDYLVAEPLRGFSETDAQAFMEASQVHLLEDFFRRLYALTEGNPMLLRLSLSTIQNGKGEI